MVLVGLERVNLMLISFLLLTETAGGIDGDTSTLKSSGFGVNWGQYAKNGFSRGWLKNRLLVDQTTRVSNLTVTPGPEQC